MALENSSCPNDSNLRAVLEGTLSESEQAAVSRHLDRCQACQKRLEELAGLPGFRFDTASAPNSGPNSDLRDVLAGLRDDLDALDEDPSETCDEAILRLLSPSEEPSHLGRLGAYEILEVIGQGGMGIVFKGLDPRLNRFVAIKVLYPQLAANPIARRRFLREAQAAAAISHDHVVAIHAVEEASGFPLLVMEYIGGISLQERINRTGTLEVKEILRIGSQMAAGLAAAHNQGVIHRDIKPANILLEHGIERVKITDFGLARAMDDVQLTQSGILAGTPQYMSPEQASGEPVDHRTDLFSLGAVMYAMCTGHSPFRAETALGSLRRVIEDTARPIQEVNSDIPDWLSEIVEILLAKVPAERLPSASDVAELLEQHLAHLQQPSAVPMPPRLRSGIEPPRHPLLRRRWIFGGLGVLLLMFAGLGASEATSITKLHELVTTFIKVWTPQGTLIVEVADPQVKVGIDGEEGSVVVTGAGIHKLSLHPGDYQVQATKQGQAFCEDLVSVERNGQRVLRIDFEPVPDLKTTASEVAEAREVLSKTPTDPKANLVVGKHLGFMRGNWQAALPMLALGHDKTLKRLALMELAGASTAEEQVTAGDAWWKLAQAGEPSALQHIRMRAGYWYRKAFPELSGRRQGQVKARLNEVDDLTFSRFQAAAKGVSINKTRVVGGRGGGPFEDIPKEPSLLVGFVVTAAHSYGGHLVINSLQPIYLTSMGQRPSVAYGRQSTYEVRVEAEDGYAVGGIIAQGGHRLDGFSVIFMRLEGRRLNPKDSYESDWLGGKDRVGGTVLGADGHPVIGIHGKYGAEVDCMGLVQAVIDAPD